MLTFKQLYDSTIFFSHWRGSYPDVTTELVAIIPNLLTHQITFKYRAKSASNSNEGYNVYVQFYNVNMDIKPITTNSIKIVDKDGDSVYFERISITDPNPKNWCRVRCGCMDFRHRFAWEDRAVNALYGPPPPSYTPVPGSKRGPVNPEHIPGFCKHIFAAVRDHQRFFMR